MSQTWFLFTPLPAKQALELVEGCCEEIRQFLERNPECDDAYGDVGGGGPIPTAADVADAHRRYRLPLADSILERIAECRSSLAIDRPHGGRTASGEYLDISPLQVSILRYLLRRSGSGLLMFNDYPLVHSRIVLFDLQALAGAADFPE